MTINRNKTRNNTQKIKVFQKQSADAKYNFKKHLIEQEKAEEQKKAEEQEKAEEQRKAEEQTKSREYFFGLSYAELRKEAKASNIENYWRKKKQQLVEELTKTNG